MITYADRGNCLTIGNMSIPKDPKNADYARALAEVSTGEAEIVSYVPPAVDPPRILDPEDFMALLTAGEFDAIMSSPNAAVIKWRNLVPWRRKINLDAPATATLIAGAVALNILTQARADRVLSGFPPP